MKNGQKLLHKVRKTSPAFRSLAYPCCKTFTPGGYLLLAILVIKAKSAKNLSPPIFNFQYMFTSNFLYYVGPRYIMNTKTEMCQYVNFRKLRKFETADIKCFTVFCTVTVHTKSHSIHVNMILFGSFLALSPVPIL